LSSSTLPLRAGGLGTHKDLVSFIGGLERITLENKNYLEQGTGGSRL
jgi:hypothetical protein